MTDRVGQQLGNYRLLRLIGQGGFADVYLSEHIYLKTQVALKVLTTRLGHDDLQDFLAEAQTSASLEHPHIVRVQDFGVEGGSLPYLVMSYAPGGTLRQHNPKGTRLPLPTIVSYVQQIASALQYVHDRGLIHRDIKPENMLLRRNDEVLLSDFGVAAVAHRTITQSIQQVAGTALYMAPEQFRGKPRPATDQYALAVVVYEWLCGERPFRGSFPELCSQHLFEPPPPLREKIPSLPSSVEQVVDKALAKDPQQRFARVQDFADALQQAHSVQQHPQPVPPLQQGNPVTHTLYPLPDPQPASPPPAIPALSTTVLSPPPSPPPQELAPTPNGRTGETVFPVSPPREQTAGSPGRRGFSRGRVVLLSGLLLLVVLGSAGLLSYSTLRCILSPTDPVCVDSNGAMFGFDVQHTHFNPSEHILNPSNVSHLVPYWTYTTGNTIYSSPVIANGLVYVGSADGKLYALDAKTGAFLWAYLTGDVISSSPVVANGLVYVGSYDHKLYALDARTGTLQWSYTTGNAILSSPAVANGLVYVGSGDNKFYALDARTGAFLWAYSTGSIISSSPAVANGLVYVGSYDHKLYALDAKTGAFLWAYTTGNQIYSSPAVANGVVYVGSHDGKLYALDAKTGAVLWTYTTGSYISSSPAVVNGVVYVGSWDHKLYALDAKTGAFLWAYSTGGSIYSDPMVANGVVYVGSADYKLYALDAKTGTFLWAYSTGSIIYDSPAVANGLVYVGSFDDKLYAFHLPSGTT